MVEWGPTWDLLLRCLDRMVTGLEFLGDLLFLFLAWRRALLILTGLLWERFSILLLTRPENPRLNSLDGKLCWFTATVLTIWPHSLIWLYPPSIFHVYPLIYRLSAWTALPDGRQSSLSQLATSSFTIPSFTAPQAMASMGDRFSPPPFLALYHVGKRKVSGFPVKPSPCVYN